MTLTYAGTRVVGRTVKIGACGHRVHHHRASTTGRGASTRWSSRPAAVGANTHHHLRLRRRRPAVASVFRAQGPRGRRLQLRQPRLPAVGETPRERGLRATATSATSTTTRSATRAQARRGGQLHQPRPASTSDLTFTYDRAFAPHPGQGQGLRRRPAHRQGVHLRHRQLGQRQASGQAVDRRPLQLHHLRHHALHRADARDLHLRRRRRPGLGPLAAVLRRGHRRRQLHPGLGVQRRRRGDHPDLAPLHPGDLQRHRPDLAHHDLHLHQRLAHRGSQLRHRDRRSSQRNGRLGNHQNGTTDTVGADPNGMRRPASYATTGPTTCCPAPTPTTAPATSPRSAARASPTTSSPGSPPARCRWPAPAPGRSRPRAPPSTPTATSPP